MPKGLQNMQYVPIIQSLCPRCGEGLEVGLMDRFKVIEYRIERLQFCDKGVAILFLIMSLVTAFCAVSHLLKP